MPNKKLAAVVTVYRKYSHGQHIVDRFLDGYGWNGEYHHPPFDLLGMYVDQVGADDLSRERAAPASVHENLFHDCGRAHAGHWEVGSGWRDVCG